MTFFTDRDLGAEIFPSILRDAGLSVERHIDHFKPAARDEEWLPVVAHRGWFVLTNDKGILRKPIQRDIVVKYGGGLFILVGGDMTAHVLAQNFVNTFSKVERFISEHDLPFIAKIYRPSPLSLIESGRPGRVELKFPLG